MVLEWEQHWDTFGVGGTCNYGTHNFFIGDVDDDGVLELITGGYSYPSSDYNYTDVEAPLRIWNWDGTNFNIEKDHNWPGSIRSIYAGDLDGDSIVEILTASFSTLRLWNWNNEALTSKTQYVGISARSMFISDVNNDQIPELLIVGSVYGDNGSGTQLQVLKWNKTTTSLELVAYSKTQANSVCAVDLNNDGVIEIVTGGYSNNLTSSRGEISVWTLNGETLVLRDRNEWCSIEEGYGVGISGAPMGNTMVSNLKIGDVDDDGFEEIVAGGFTYDGEKVNAQLTIWNWSSHVLELEKSQEWRSRDITEVKSISLNDVDGDGSLDIINSGFIGVYGGFSDVDKPAEQAQLRVWSWDGEELKLKVGHDWDVGEGVTAWNVATGDVDNDGTVEIVTIGCMYVSNLCDPDLRIWSIASNAGSFPYDILPVALAVVVVIIIAIFIAKKKRWV
ncbi:MAG: hypothetical protein CW691_11080 [Candidatus Bathyarchaeum sp.]|nr:MAG: hypothetical protein CW691_11080 [Candidatus Bathyarchaeum sp.]